MRKKQRKNKKIWKTVWSKIRDSVRPITKNSNDYDKKYMKTKFNSDEELHLNKKAEISMIIVVRPVFHELFFYYPAVLRWTSM